MWSSHKNSISFFGYSERMTDLLDSLTNFESISHVPTHFQNDKKDSYQLEH